MKYIFSRQPHNYPQQQNMIDCGIFSVKAVIEAYFPNKRQAPTKYTLSRIHQIIRLSLPRQVAKMCRRSGLYIQQGKCKAKTNKDISIFLEKVLSEGPLILTIGHGYNKKRTYHWVKSFLFQHYISVRGYDKEKQVFYCYDSRTDLEDTTLPIGNTALPYETLIKHWKLGGRGIYNKRYIAIKGTITQHQ